MMRELLIGFIASLLATAVWERRRVMVAIGKSLLRVAGCLSIAGAWLIQRGGSLMLSGLSTKFLLTS